MRSLGDLGEFGLIARLTGGLSGHEDVLLGPGDDCAVVRAGDRVWLLSIDASIEEVHFSRRTAAPRDIGYKAAAAAISDIAAMGGAPRFLLVTLACPAHTPLDTLDAVYAGLREAADGAGACVVGGDVAKAPQLVLDVAVVGEVSEGRYVTRAGAQPGDVLAVTGWPGRSAAGLAALDAGLDAPELVRAHLHPEPRVAAGQWLAREHAVRAMIDVSDGLLQDAGHLAEAGGLAVDLETARLPIAPELEAWRGRSPLSPEAALLAGGEDYELAVALDPGRAGEICARFQAACGLPLTVAGRFVAGAPGVRIDGAAPGHPGYDHFRR